MPYQTVSNNEGTHVMLDGVEIAIKPDRASALEFIAGQATRRAEAAEARAAQAEAERDEARTALSRAESTAKSNGEMWAQCDRQLKLVTADYIEQANTIRELRAELEQAQRKIAQMESYQHDPRVPIQARDPRRDGD